jgi:gliding motility-associated-like protein
MRNFIIAFEKKIQLQILFALFIGITSSYGQNKNISNLERNSKQSSSEGYIDIRNKNYHVVGSDKTFIANKKKSSTAKTTTDTEAPVITCPPNQQLACGSLIPSYFNILSATDNIDTEIEVTQNPGEGSDFYDGMEIKFTATDDAGNKSECSIVVTASSTDINPPTFTCPTGLTFNCGDVMPNYALDPMMNLDDDCSLNVKYIMSPGPGSDFYDGIPVQIEYFDKSGNRSVCNFTVAMAVPDVIKPIITFCPGTQSLACGALLPDYRGVIEATDNCLENMTVSQSPGPGSTFVPGTTVTITVSDAANNTTNCSFIVNAAADTTKPTITCPGNQSLAIGSVLPDYSSLLSVSDNCDTNPLIVQTPAAGTVFNTNGTTVTLKATDASGNYDTCSFIVNNSGGDLPPVIECPSGQELLANSTLPNYVFLLKDISDDVTDNLDLQFTQTPPQGTLFTADTNVTITVKDESGNINTCTFPVKLKISNVALDCKTNNVFSSNLNPKDGVKIHGEKADGNTGYSVSGAGDVNGDGIDDFLIGASGNYQPWYGKDKIMKFIEGAAYLVYGNAAGFPPNIDLALLNGANGFKIRNDIPFSDFPNTGYDVSSAGDINGDGISDFMVSDPYRHTSNGTQNGNTYVVFGRTSGFPAELLLSTLNGTNGFSVMGTINYSAAGHAISSVGDINGDGMQDIAIITSGSTANNGKCYVVYGRNSGFPAVIKTDQINGTNGFVIEGDAVAGKVGNKVAGLGDINGDGFPDIGLGSYNGSDQHRKFVVYGRSSNFPATLNVATLNGTNGFILENTASPLNSFDGISNLGDINGDGYNDIAVTGSYILFGGTTIPALMDLKNLNGINGFKLLAGGKMASIGDFNKDGIGDFGIIENSGAYVIYGKTDWTSTTIDFTFLNGLKPSQGIKIGLFNYRNYDIALAGDVNQDGVDDFIIGTSNDEYNLDVNNDPGYAYVIYGKKISDSEKPVITNCPFDKVLTIQDPIPDYTKVISVTDNCDTKPVITQTPVAGTVFNGITQEITITATDASGNFESCKFTVSQTADTEAPVLTCPSDQQLACGSLLPDYLNLVTVSDNQDPLPVITQSPIAGSPFTDGMTVTITAKDASGNSEKCSFLVNTSADVTKPVITCAGNQILNAGDVLPDYSGLITVTDNCDTAPIITQEPAAGSPFVNGMTITVSAADASENKATCSFIVNEAADTEAPVIACISNQNLNCTTLIIPDYTAIVTVTDNRDSNPVITQSPVAGSPFVDGMKVTITAQDASNNIASCDFKISVSSDIIKPVIICIGNQTLPAGAILPDYTDKVTATDNCDSNLTIVQTPSAGNPVTNGMEVQMKVTDNSGNESDCFFTITTTAEPDTTSPVITCIADQKVPCNTVKVPDYTSKVIVVDDKDPIPVVKQSPAPGSAFTANMTIVITATDASSNKSTCSFKIDSDILLVDAGDDIEIKMGESVQLQAIATEEGSFKWTPAKGISNPFISDPLFTPEQTTTYTVYFTNKEGCEIHDSVIIMVEPKEKDETKYGFSPNNDGINDFWMIHDITKYPNNEVSIYSSWGDLVFQTKGYNNSTNVFSGIANRKRNLGADLLPEGTYFFEINPNSPSHHFKKLKGYLVLKR